MLGFPGGSEVKNPPASARRGFNPWVRKIPWKRKCNPCQHSCLENPKDRGAWRATAHGVAKSQTRLSTHMKICISEFAGGLYPLGESNTRFPKYPSEPLVQLVKKHWFGKCQRPILLSKDIAVVAVQSPSHVQLFATPWMAACQASCSSPFPGVCSSSCSLHQWCHPAISFSDALFSF